MAESAPDHNLYLFAAGLFSATIGFLVYYFSISFLRTRNHLVRKKDPSDNYRFVIFKRLYGFLIFGILPLVSVMIITHGNIHPHGMNISFDQGFTKWVFIPGMIIILMNYFVGSNKQNLLTYPEIRNREWSLSLFILSTMSWAAYLLGYEFLFRGLLLFPAVELMGFWPAVFLNVILYSLVHVPKGMRETVGAIPLGLVLCYLSVMTGSFWIAFIIHIILALSNEWFSLMFHPEIKLVRIK